MVCLSQYLEIEQVYSKIANAGAQSVAMCSANSGEGITSISIALARRCVAANKRTLLVDMNYCRPMLDQQFEIPRSAWNADGDSWQAAIQTTDSGIDVLTASLDPESNIRQHSCFTTMRSAWHEAYDVVVFDTSPLLAINRQNIPAEQVSAQADATLMIVQSAATKETDILEALSKLKNQHIEPLGWIMNDRHCPSLRSEMQRELTRLQRYFPRAARWLEQHVLKSDLINQVV